jgi:hypothetical protein
MHTPGTKAVLVTAILLVALLAGCSKGNSASTDPVTSSQEQQAPFIAQAALVTGADGIAIDNYVLVSSTRISRTVFQYTYNADVSNWGSGDATITATLASTAPEITVMEGALDFGDVPLGATQQSTDTFTIRVDRSQPFNENALVWTAQATPLPPTTFQLIDQALANGTIDAETALLYKVYHEFHDSRLPAQYVGRDDGSREATAIQDAIENFDTLSQPTQDLLRPFLLPPNDPASWYQQRLSQLPAQSIGLMPAPLKAAVTAAAANPACADYPPPPAAPRTSAILTENGKVCIHYYLSYPEDENTAVLLADEINGKIWPALTALLGNPPTGTDGLLHVYLADSDTVTHVYGEDADGILGLTKNTCGQGVVPVIYLDHNKKVDINQTAAHEITHAITARFVPIAGCPGNRWLREATGTWAEQFVYPSVQTEQPYARFLLNVPETSLDAPPNGEHEYGAYLWFLYLTKGDNSNAQKVAQVWNALAGSDSLHAINSVIAGEGGLGQKWHEFALYNWNRVVKTNVGPVPTGGCSIVGKPYTYYAQWDCLLDKARESTGASPEIVKLNGAVARTYFLPHRVNHLAAKYYHYDFTQDDTIRRVRLVQPYKSISTAGKAKVQVLVKLRDGNWLPVQDWTGFDYKTLCRDKPLEDFQELVVVISNSEFDDRSFVLDDDGTASNGGSDKVLTKLQVSALGCSNWKGSVKGSYISGNVNDDVSSTMNTQDATFEFVPGSETWTDTSDTQDYKITGGSVSWKSDETLNIGVTCTGSFSGTYSLANTTLNEATLTLGVNGKPDYAIDAKMVPVASGGSWTVDPFAYQLTCQDLGSFQPYAFLIVNEWFSVYKSNGPNIPTLPGIYDTAGGLFDGHLAGFATLFTQSPGEEYDYLWDLKKNGAFDSDQ